MSHCLIDHFRPMIQDWSLESCLVPENAGTLLIRQKEDSFPGASLWKLAIVADRAALPHLAHWDLSSSAGKSNRLQELRAARS